MRRMTSRTSTAPMVFRRLRGMQADVGLADQAVRAGRAVAEIVVPADGGGGADGVPVDPAAGHRAAAETANNWPSRWNVADAVQDRTTARPVGSGFAVVFVGCIRGKESRLVRGGVLRSRFYGARSTLSVNGSFDVYRG
jgi:hypothetical protein